jgi:hypothetical protein
MHGGRGARLNAAMTDPVTDISDDAGTATTTTWVAVVGAESARIYELEAGNDSLRPVDTVDCADVASTSHTKEAAPADRPFTGAAANTRCDDWMARIRAVSNATGRRLDRWYQRGRFDHLVIVAPEALLPLDTLSPSLRSALLLEMELDAAHHTTAMIRASLPL